VNRSRIRGRRIGGILAASLFIVSTMPGMVAAANNRVVYFGSPDGTGGGYDSNGQLVFGTLTNTTVTEGKKWATVLVVRNDSPSGSTLNHVKISGGADADGKPYNPLFPKPTSGNSLTGGATFAAVTVLEGSATCSQTSGASIACDVGTLVAGAFTKFLIVVNAPATKGIASWGLTGSWNEGWSSTGTNADYNFATGSVDVKESNCGNGQASYFLSTEKVDLSDGGSTSVCATQDAGIKSGSALGSNGGFAQVVIDTADITCPAIYKCFGKPVTVSILGGNPVPGGVEWTVTWYGTKTVKGVLHVSDGATPTFTPIYLTRSYKCSDTVLRDCWKSVTPSAGNAKPASVTVVFVTDSNGKGIGF
jgi:hypothetical protein